MPTPVVVHALRAAALAASLLFTACASMEPPEGPPRKETVLAATVNGELIRFNAGQPSRVLSRVAVSGLDSGDRLVGIDFRVARGVLYALSARGRLYALDAANGQLTAVGAGGALAAGDQALGFDFNPVADRIRVVTAGGRNLRLHPDTGALAAEDAALRYADGDAAAGTPARVGAAAYTYNKNDARLTTNYAIDVARGTLLRQGSLEGTQPVVSPNTGLLATVGALGTGAVDDAAFDIADVGNTALAALRHGGVTRLHLIDLASGRATALGRVADGQALAGLAIEP
jgi:outer membrane protein assembly factor BamB